MSEEERSRLQGTFEDEQGFRRLLAESTKVAKVVPSPFFQKPRRFRGGRRPDDAAAGYDFQRFEGSKHLFIVALETGLAQGDLLRLKWSAVDLRTGWIRIQRGKTKVEAAIPISRACREALTTCKRKAVVGDKVSYGVGRPYSVATVNRVFQEGEGDRGDHSAASVSRSAAHIRVSACFQGGLAPDDREGAGSLDNRDGRAVCPSERGGLEGGGHKRPGFA